ncbi:MAG: DUF4292 domain-containing protein [Methanoregula sp.]|jgi:hypothetical protein|nr:DUF4292 domain-containing protein [Methanoregula sp.]
MTQNQRLSMKVLYNFFFPANKLLFIFLSSLFLSSIFYSCNPQKKVFKTPIKEEGAEYLFGKLKEHEFKFSGLTAKFTAEYENKDDKKSLDGQIRILRDSLIWITITPVLGIEVMRIMISQDSVKFINRMNNTYFIGDYIYVNNFLNTNIDFDLLQSFLTGNDLSFYENGEFKASLDNGRYKLSTAERSKLKKFVRNSQENLRILIQNIWIDPVTFKISQADVKEIRRQNIKLEARYTDYETLEDQLFPKRMIFEIAADNNIHVDIQFSRININSPLTFPFKIPQSYKQIK